MGIRPVSEHQLLSDVWNAEKKSRKLEAKMWNAIYDARQAGVPMSQVLDGLPMSKRTIQYRLGSMGGHVTPTPMPTRPVKPQKPTETYGTNTLDYSTGSLCGLPIPATQHRFMDGQWGVRIEDPNRNHQAGERIAVQVAPTTGDHWAAIVEVTPEKQPRKKGPATYGVVIAATNDIEQNQPKLPVGDDYEDLDDIPWINETGR